MTIIFSLGKNPIMSLNSVELPRIADYRLMIKAIHHVSILTSDLGRSIRFYSGILGLAVSDKRPDLGFDGAWFDLGGQQIHLIHPDPVGSPHKPEVRCGRDRHVAFQVEDIDQLIEKLDSAGIEFERSRSGRPALFCRDPDGNALEFIGSN
jgi:glyoxylase I family protein